MIIKIDEAKAYALLKTGKKIEDKDMYLEIWKDSKIAYQNWSNLRSGRTKNPRIEWLNIISKLTGVTVPFLLGTEKLKEFK